ncbi:MAG: hypothetical protein AAGF24_00025 [Cyanobacteria bacterium P01_H01_bin.121]
MTLTQAGEITVAELSEWSHEKEARIAELLKLEQDPVQHAALVVYAAELKILRQKILGIAQGIIQCRTGMRAED